jgi:hypothetical protein
MKADAAEVCQALTVGFRAAELSARLCPPIDFDPHRRLARLGRPANVARLS